LPGYPSAIPSQGAAGHRNHQQHSFQAVVKEFSTGSLGWYLNGKTMVEVDGLPVAVQIGLNLTVVGSKELAKEGGS
jgi:hypothetical protein